MQVLPAVLSLVLPAVAALLACRRIGNWGNRAVNALVGLVIYVLLFLIPIHVIASLQLIGMMSAISLWHIAILDLTLVLMLLIWHHFAPPRPNSEFAGAQDKSFFQSLPKSVIISVIIVGGCYFAFALNLFTSYP